SGALPIYVLSGAAGVDPEALTLGGGLGLSVPPVGEVVQFFDAFDARADALDDHPASASAQPLVLTRLRSSGHVVESEFAGIGDSLGQVIGQGVEVDVLGFFRLRQFVDDVADGVSVRVVEGADAGDGCLHGYVVE